MSFFDTVRSRPAALFGLIVALVLAGAFTAVRMPASIYPSVTFPIVKVIADVGDEPAARMMPTVTRPLEEAVRRVPGEILVRSTTSRGSCELSADFAWGTDMETALERVRGETQRILPDLPPGTHIDVEWMNTAVFPIQGYALTSDTLTQAQLWDLAEYTIKPALLGIQGVSQIQIQGGRQREFQIHLSPAALQGRGMSAADVVDAIRADNDVLSAGLTEENHELYLTLVNGRVHAEHTLAQIAVPVPHGPPVTLGQLGTLDVANEVSYVRTTADGRPAVLVNIVRQPSGNTVTIANDVTRLMKSRKDLLPSGVTWTTWYDQARFVSGAVNGTRDAIVIGVILAMFVLFGFLQDWRTTLVAGAAIPVTIAIVGLALAATGQTINLMTLGGIAAAIGLIADDAIVVVEDIERHIEEGDSYPVRSSLHALWPALVGSSLSTIIIFLPFSLLPGVTGAFFKPLALTMALALIVSFFVAVLAAPVAVAALEGIRRGGESRREGSALADSTAVLRWAHGGSGAPLADTSEPRGLRAVWRRVTHRADVAYRGVTDLFVDHGSVAVVALLVLLGGGWLVYSHIGTDFLPTMDEGSIVLDYWTPPGTSLTDTNEMLDEIEHEIIMKNPAVMSYSRRTGTQLGFFITEPNRGDYLINLRPRAERRPVEEVINELRRRIKQVEPAMHVDFGQFIEDNLGDLTGGEPQPIDIKIFGSDPAVLERKAKQITSILSHVRGTADAFDGITIAGPALNIQVKPDAAARYGLTTQDIHAAVEPAILGTVVDKIRVGDRMYDMRLFEQHPGSLGDLLVRAGTALIPLGPARDGDRPPEPQDVRGRDRPALGPRPGEHDRRDPGQHPERGAARSRDVHPVRRPVQAGGAVLPGSALCAHGRRGAGRAARAVRVRRLARVRGHGPLGPGGAGRIARAASGHRQDPQHLQLRGCDHDGGDRRREHHVRHQQCATGDARRTPAA
jgi:cobalt-zinc-cadmium resistance protein CzcA